MSLSDGFSWKRTGRYLNRPNDAKYGSRNWQRQPDDPWNCEFLSALEYVLHSMQWARLAVLNRSLSDDILLKKHNWRICFFVSSPSYSYLAWFLCWRHALYLDRWQTLQLVWKEYNMNLQQYWAIVGMLFTIHQKRHGVKINKLQKLALISPYTALKSNKGRETECVSRGVWRVMLLYRTKLFSVEGMWAY